MYNVVKECSAGKDVANIGNAVNIGRVKPDVNRKCGTKLSGSRLTYKAGHGFTLIELLVVVLIIGILAAVAVPQYQKAVEKNRYAEAVQTVANLEKSIDLWILENGLPADVMFVAGDYAWDQYSGKREELPIDVGCKSADGLFCAGKNFSFNAGCVGSNCMILVYGPDQWEYLLYSERDLEGIWRRTCGYHNTLQKVGCEYLESNGGWKSRAGDPS